MITPRQLYAIIMVVIMLLLIFSVLAFKQGSENLGFAYGYGYGY